MCGDPFITATMPGYYSLGVNKIAEAVHQGGAIPMLLMEWTPDSTLINHFEEFTYRTAEGAVVPVQVVPAGLAWNSLPNNLKDTASVHPSPNGSYLAAASIYSTLVGRSAATCQYTYNDSIANVAEISWVNALNQNHYSGQVTFMSPYKSCGVSDPNLIYNHGGTSTENGFLGGLQWVVAANQKTLQYGATAPVHFNYGRSSMGTTHLYQIDSVNFDHSLGYPLQDNAGTGLVSMLYGLDKRANSTDVETDLGTARQMLNQSELPYARNVPLRTIIAQMIDEIPGVSVYAPNDNWHLSSDVNIAVASYMYTILTSDCTLPPSDSICSDSTEWRTWMAHKIGQETAWNVMYLQGANSCNKLVDSVTACDSYTWINGVTYTSSNSAATFTYTNMAGCDSSVILNLTIMAPNASVTVSGGTFTANQAGATYEWLDCTTGAVVIGANSQSFIPPTMGDYAVIVTYNSCTDTSACYNLAMNVGSENSFGNELLMYPNPTSENVRIDLGGQHQNVIVVVSNLLGQEIVHKTYPSTSQVDLHIEGSAGIYFVMISSNDKKASLKLIKK